MRATAPRSALETTNAEQVPALCGQLLGGVDLRRVYGHGVARAPSQTGRQPSIRRGAWTRRVARWLGSAWRSPRLRPFARWLPSPLFDPRWYAMTYPDVPRGAVRSWLHWRRHGWREARNPNALFDTRWYLDTNPEVRTLGIDPLGHYLASDVQQDPDPSPAFCGSWYLERYPDVQAAGMDPLLHYLLDGAAEGREIRPSPAAVTMRILDSAGQDVWHIEADETRGASVSLTGDGALLFAGHQDSEAHATLVSRKAFPSSDYVFETRFSLGQPQAFQAHMLFIAVRVADPGSAPAYRISYRFVEPSTVAYNNTGFYLINTGDPAFLADPVNAIPVAGARYRLAYDREYIARTVVRDVPGGVNIRFYLEDPSLAGDRDDPLFEYTDHSEGRLVGNGHARVQVGAGSLSYPAPQVRFTGMRLYSEEHLAEAPRWHATPTAHSAPRSSASLPTASPGRTELPNVFSDKMVLQQHRRIRVWGRGIEGDEVTVSLADRTAKGRVSNGRWMAELDPVPAGGPYLLRVTGQDRTIDVRDVLVGEVWVLGGQSNMGWPLSKTNEASKEIPRSDFPRMRIFSSWHPAADVPQFHMAGATWKVVSPALKGDLSAVGYYFGKALQERLDVPIGLIDTSTPATEIEPWLSREAAETVYPALRDEQSGRFTVTRQDPSVFYNAKVAPVMPFMVAGILWYQGDSSHPTVGYSYRDIIPVLIEDWRTGFAQGTLPFLAVQIPRYLGCSPEMRESQLRADPGGCQGRSCRDHRLGGSG